MDFELETTVASTSMPDGSERFYITGTLTGTADTTAPASGKAVRAITISDGGDNTSVVYYDLPVGLEIPVQLGVQYDVTYHRPLHVSIGRPGLVVVRRGPPAEWVFVGDAGGAFTSEDPDTGPFKVYRAPRPECPETAYPACGINYRNDAIRFVFSRDASTQEAVVNTGEHGLLAAPHATESEFSAVNIASWSLLGSCPGAVDSLAYLLLNRSPN
jgi:hypothetical protein